MVMEPLIELCWVLDGWDIHKWGSPVDMLLGPWITFIFSCNQSKTEQNKTKAFFSCRECLHTVDSWADEETRSLFWGQGLFSISMVQTPGAT